VQRTTVVIIGAGQAGLAMSHCLSERQIEHVLLERGAVAARWRAHGWDSLRLLTPNWMTRLPAFHDHGGDPDGYMRARDVVALLDEYAVRVSAPVITDTAVECVESAGDEFSVATTRGSWRAPVVVIATGYCDIPYKPAVSSRLAVDIQQLTPAEYRNPDQLTGPGVLVVGASSSGIQLAEEIHGSGRHVVLAVGRHTRLPRSYRGRDILWWLDRMGALAQDAASVHALSVSRAQPSLQLLGRPDRASLDLGMLFNQGVRVAGRLAGIEKHRVRFASDLLATTVAADVKLASVLMRIDEFIRRTDAFATPPPPFTPTWPAARRALTQIDLRAERIGTVIWATGYRRAYPWLRIPVLDRHGEIRHTGGMTPCPGLYVLGMHFQSRRNSSFLDGVGRDAQDLASHIAAVLRLRQIA
jgi:putative flavoprotein involved in K+ transport